METSAHRGRHWTSRQNLTSPELHLENQVQKFPWQVILLMVFSLTESFNEYGMASMFSIYMSGKLGYGESTSTMTYHLYKVVKSSIPLAAALLADTILGKFWTLVGGMCFLQFGSTLVSTSTINAIALDQRHVFMVGLFLMASGAGVLRATNYPFVIDQFSKKEHISLYFTVLFYLTNTLLFGAMFTIPLLERSVSCFGDSGCYPFPFFLCSSLLFAGIVTFLSGKNRYRRKKPVRNLYWDLIRCIKVKYCRRRGVCDEQTAVDLKALLAITCLVSPFIFYWALYDQQASSWTFQAGRMDGSIGELRITPSQMQCANPLLIVLLLPVFQWVVFPVLRRMGVLTTPLQRMAAGGFLMATSFVIAAILEMQIAGSYADLPSKNEAQLRLYNGGDSPVTLKSEWFGERALAKQGLLEVKEIPVTGTARTLLQVGTTRTRAEISPQQGVSYVILPNQDIVRVKDFDIIMKDVTGNPTIRVLCLDGCSLNNDHDKIKELSRDIAGSNKPELSALREKEGFVTTQRGNSHSTQAAGSSQPPFVGEKLMMEDGNSSRTSSATSPPLKKLAIPSFGSSTLNEQGSRVKRYQSSTLIKTHFDNIQSCRNNHERPKQQQTSSRAKDHRRLERCNRKNYMMRQDMKEINKCVPKARSNQTAFVLNKREARKASCKGACGSDQLVLVDKFGKQTKIKLPTTGHSTTLVLPKSSSYNISFKSKVIEEKVDLLSGGVYTLLFRDINKPDIFIYTITKPNTVHILWQIPQYVVLTSAEILVAIASQVFLFTQAPIRLRSLVAAVGMLTNAAGDLTVAVIVQSGLLHRQFQEFLLYAGLLYAAMCIFIWFAYKYKWREWKED